MTKTMDAQQRILTGYGQILGGFSTLALLMAPFPSFVGTKLANKIQHDGCEIKYVEDAKFLLQKSKNVLR